MSKRQCYNHYSWLIKDSIAIGDWKAGTDLEELRKHNIRGIIAATLRLPLSVRDYMKYQMAVLHVPVNDHPQESIMRWFSPTRDFIDYFLQRGYGVLIHCAAGKSRSVTLLASYLMKTFSLSPHFALNIIRASRPCIAVNYGFQSQLVHYWNSLKESSHIRRSSRHSSRRRSRKVGKKKDKIKK